MKKSRFTDSQIIAVLKQAEAGTPVPELCREHGISSATFYKWRSKFGGMDVSMVGRMKELEEENRRLKKMYADAQLSADLLKSNCPVTGQPDWASVRLAYRGPRIDRAGLLRYLVSFREHAGFHEQCVERIFVDVLARCRPEALAVEARYTRRGGLDINPLRVLPGTAMPAAERDVRQ